MWFLRIILVKHCHRKLVISKRSCFWDSMPLAIEYLVFSLLFCVIVFLSFGKKGLAGFALPALFAGLVGVLYTIDNVFPYGQFTPFQLLVPTTATLAAGVLGLMGNTVVSGTEIGTGMPTLQVTGRIGNSKVRDSVALRRHRKSTYLYGCGFAVFEADEHFLESQNRLLRLWCSSHLLHKCSANSNYFHHWDAVWSKLKSSANIPLLLWTLVRDGMDYFLSTVYSCKPRVMAKNQRIRKPQPIQLNPA